MRISTLKTAAVLLCMGATAGAAAQIMAPAQITPDMVDTRHFSPQTAEEFVPVNTEYLVNTDAFGMARTSTRETGAEFQFALQPGANYAILFKCLSTAEEVTIPDTIHFQGAVYPVEEIYKQAFAARTKLKTLNFGKNIKRIDSQAFMACNTLSTINLNEGLLEIGDQAFYMFLKNVKSLTLPSTVETLGERAFSGCNISGEFIINKNLKTIGGGAFAGNSITGFYINENGNDYFTSKDGVLYTKDGQSLVVFPPALVGEELTIPDGTVKIAPYALSNSTKVKKINLPESLKEIGNFAFRSCNLQDITLGLST